MFGIYHAVYLSVFGEPGSCKPFTAPIPSESSGLKACLLGLYDKPAFSPGFLHGVSGHPTVVPHPTANADRSAAVSAQR